MARPSFEDCEVSFLHEAAACMIKTVALTSFQFVLCSL